MVTFQPYETKLISVDLSKSYDLSKGGDYTVGTLDSAERSALEACGAKIKLVKFKPGYSTSSIVARIKRAR